LSHVLLALLLLASPHPLSSDDPALRQRAALAWSRAHGPVKLPWPSKPDPDGSRPEPRCVELRAPRASGCAASTWACPLESSQGSCSGASSWELRVAFSERPEPSPPGDEERPELLLRTVSGDDAPELECAPVSGLAFVGARAPAEERKARATWEREQAREQARCIERARRRQAAERVVFRCDLLLVNPCRREAFVRCGGKNLERADWLPGPGVRRFTW
jgi:hypothetical protein